MTLLSLYWECSTLNKRCRGRAAHKKSRSPGRARYLNLIKRHCGTVRRGVREGRPVLMGTQKCTIKPLAAMNARFLDGGIPALTLPLKASAFSER